METISNNDYIEFLNKTDDKYNNNYYRTIIIKPIDDKSGTYIEYSIDGNRRKHEFRIGNHAKIWKYKNVFTKGHTPSWFKKLF